MKFNKKRLINVYIPLIIILLVFIVLNLNKPSITGKHSEERTDLMNAIDKLTNVNGSKETNELFEKAELEMTKKEFLKITNISPDSIEKNNNMEYWYFKNIQITFLDNKVYSKFKVE